MALGRWAKLLASTLLVAGTARLALSDNACPSGNPEDDLEHKTIVGSVLKGHNGESTGEDFPRPKDRHPGPYRDRRRRGRACRPVLRLCATNKSRYPTPSTTPRLRRVPLVPRIHERGPGSAGRARPPDRIRREC